jgi:hypothetical protein
MKIASACEYLGGVNPKLLYAAVRRGDCKAARIGAGRNLLFSAEDLDQYAQSTKRSAEPREAGRQ